MTADLSISFYNYLCQKLGTEDMVKIRRLCYNIYDYISPFNTRFVVPFYGRPVISISSGSKAEGLDMKRSDLDIMLVNEFINVVEDPLDRFGFYSFLISAEYTTPGFVRLKLHHYVVPLFNFWCSERDGYIFLSSEKFKMKYFSNIKPCSNVILHGPCITTADESHDLAFCLRAKSWIAQAQNWVFRNRVWPSCELVSKIVSYGVLFVPIGRKKSLNEDLEWRISFSMAEKHLIYSFTHIQLLTYALLKILLKEVIELDTVCKGLLCSYFIKTLLFWVFEEESSSSEPHNLIPYFDRLICRLRYFVKISFLPHYFIPENNLFENRFNSQQQKTLVNMLTNIYQKGIYCFLNSETVSDFFTVDFKSWKYFTGFDYELIKTPLRILKDSSFSCETPNILVELFRMFSKQKLVSHKFLYTLYWCALCQRIGKKYIGIQERSNKDHYKRHKTYLPHLIMGLQKDAHTGWLCLASYFFSMDSYHTCLILVEYILHKYGFEQSSDFDFNMFNINSLVLEAVKPGFKNVHNILMRHVLDFIGFCQTDDAWLFKLKLESLDSMYFRITPLVYTFFMRFMCYFHLGDNRSMQCTLHALQSLRIKYNEYAVDLCLGLANYALKEYSTALFFLVTFSDYYKSRYRFKTHFSTDQIDKLEKLIKKLQKIIS